MAQKYIVGESPINPGRQFIHRVFDSVTEAQKVRASNRNAERLAQTRHEGRGATWWGIAGEAVDVDRIIAQGWPEGVAKLSQLSNVELPRAESIRRKRIKTDCGDELDMQAVYRGAFDRAWQKVGKTATHGPRQVTLCADIGGNSNVDADVLFWRGAAVARLSDILSEAGYAVRIVAVQGCFRVDDAKHYDMLCETTVKGFADPLSLTNVAAVICLAGYFRTVGFSQICSIANKVAKALGQHDRGQLFRKLNPDAMMVPQDVRDAASADRWIAQCIAQLAPQAVAA